MKKFLALFLARNKEFYRDKGSLSWALIFPVLIIIGCAVAFSKEQKELFTIGILTDKTASEAIGEQPVWLNSGYNKIILYQDEHKALERLQHHQLSMVLRFEPVPGYWINPSSSEGQVLEKLLLAGNGTTTFEKNTVSGRQIRYVDWVIPGVLGMNMMFGALFGVGYVIVRYRKNGVLKRIQATPVRAYEFLAAQVTSRLMIIVSANMIIFAGTNYFLDLTMLGSYFNLLVVCILGGLSLISLGLLMAARTESEELAGGLLNMTTWPMMFMSGVWFSLDDTPIYMQKLAQCLPLTHLVNAAREIMLNGASLLDVKFNLLVMLVMTLVFLGSAALLFRWHRAS